MPKQKQDQVKKLLTNMKGSAAKAKDPASSAGWANAGQKPDCTTAKPDALHRYIDLAPYKEHQGWPGRGYLLVGNSYNMDRKVSGSSLNKKRTGSIASLLEQSKGNRHCVSVEEALRYCAFVETLSRFEYDWLRREPPSSLIGPAYNEHGKRLTNSFAVWRVDVAQTKAAHQPKQLAGAKQ